MQLKEKRLKWPSLFRLNLTIVLLDLKDDTLLIKKELIFDLQKDSDPILSLIGAGF